jgi:hypothetical protein
MSLFNETLLWFMKRRMPRIEAMYDRPLELQEQMLQGLLGHGRSTEWGSKFGYKDISDYEKFKQQVPISTYEEIFPYIDRMMQGEQNVLWDTPINWFSKSSGTTNARSKFIPVSKESLEECHMMGGKDMITLLANNKPDTKVFEGKGLSIGGSLTENPVNSSMLMGDVSAVVMKNLPIWAQIIRGLGSEDREDGAGDVEGECDEYFGRAYLDARVDRKDIRDYREEVDSGGLGEF